MPGTTYYVNVDMGGGAVTGQRPGGRGGGGGSSFIGYPVREATGGDAGDTGKPGGERPDSGGGGGGGTQTLGGKGGAACPEGFRAGTDGTPGTGGSASVQPFFRSSGAISPRMYASARPRGSDLTKRDANRACNPADTPLS
ncbi:hypothetical protein ACFVYT_27680 [Streptomyces sp. NPDC058290]|uniref:hypothetical protein n=1 Tax=Streptomyces sp. NPDC058290 TaxID=3346426 RepID=UPI0036F0984E